VDGLLLKSTGPAGVRFGAVKTVGPGDIHAADQSVIMA
jgi:hypothetical protein